MSIVQTQMFVCTDAKNNNNKFWEITLHDDGHVMTRNGRVGGSGADNDLGFGGLSLFNSKIREKDRKGYKLVPVVGVPSGKSNDKAAVNLAAQDQIAHGCPILSKLVKRLTEENRHQLLVASGGQIDVNLSTGIVKTPVGVVTLDNVLMARDYLPKLDVFVQKQQFDSVKFTTLLNEYLMLVPQKVSAARGWHTKFLPDNQSILNQSALLDQLEASIELAENEIKAQLKAAPGEPVKIFDLKLSIVDDKKVISMIEKLFKSTLNVNHTSSKLKPIRVYQIEIPTMIKAWEDHGSKIGNQKLLWHGTRTHNVLSIMKQGLIIPKSSGTSISITGRMFGDGLYFSDQSSKSLNYSYGYWDKNGNDNNCFMFLADVAMGKSYLPKKPFGGLPPSGFNSTFAEAQKSGVLNNEMIVYNTNQANLRYLIEFSN